MKTLSDRFRRWYDFERDCNAKSLQMLNSVPHEKRDAPEFQKGVDRMMHLVAARQRWLHRLGHWPDSPSAFPQQTKLEDVTKSIAATETAWTTYLNELDEAELERIVQWKIGEGKSYRWDVESILTQLFGHAWYHRGQIAQLVTSSGGQAVDTDYFFWCKLTPIETDE